MEGGSNLGDGKNGGNNISGSDIPTNNVDLVDQHFWLGSNPKVSVRLYVPLFKYSKGGEPDWTPSTTDDITERVRIYAKKPDIQNINKDGALPETKT